MKRARSPSMVVVTTSRRDYDDDDDDNTLGANLPHEIWGEIVACMPRRDYKTMLRLMVCSRTLRTLVEREIDKRVREETPASARRHLPPDTALISYTSLCYSVCAKLAHDLNTQYMAEEEDDDDDEDDGLPCYGIDWSPDSTRASYLLTYYDCYHLFNRKSVTSAIASRGIPLVMDVCFELHWSDDNDAVIAMPHQKYFRASLQ